MTPLYRLDAPAAAIAAQFGANAGDDPWSGGHIAQAQFAPVITAGREFIAGARLERTPRRMVPRLWGVQPPHMSEDTGRLVTTVRTINSPFWIGNLRNSEFRCLVPATAIMLWGRIDPVTNKRRSHWFGCSDQPLFAMAGVWKDTDIPGFALLTTVANAALGEIGQQTMPVILPADRAVQDEWLRGGWDRAQGLLAPYSSSLMREVRSAAG